MRILANSELLSPNTGISVQTLEVTEELARRGHHVDLLYMQDGPYRQRYEAFCDSMQEVTNFDLGVHHLIRDAPRLLPGIRLGVRSRPDVLYVNRYRPLPWALTTGALSRSPVVCHLHGMIGMEHPPVNRVLGRLTTRFICVSDFVRDRFLDLGGNPERTDVVHNGIDPDAYPPGGLDERRAARAVLGLPEDPLMVMYFGRIDPTKGVDVLVRALAGLDTSGRAVELLVVGSAYDEEWATRTLAGSPVPVRRLPMRTDVVTPLHAADLVVVPSVVEEAFGRTVIEGLATGRPVIGSDIGGVPEVLTGPLARFLVPPGDVPALTAAVDGALDWRQREPGLAEVCTGHVARNFTLRSMVDGVEARLVEAAR
jgi:glycosyltransferase involved in cell wall biosynthesis